MIILLKTTSCEKKNVVKTIYYNVKTKYVYGATVVASAAKITHVLHHCQLSVI